MYPEKAPGSAPVRAISNVLRRKKSVSVGPSMSITPTLLQRKVVAKLVIARNAERPTPRRRRANFRTNQFSH